MKLSAFLTVASAVVLTTSLGANSAWAAVSAEEAKQLGKNLTQFGSEKAANKDGSIPEYTGGLPVSTNPPGFKKNSGKWANPFADEKPLFSITAQNAEKYADKLSEASKALLKRYPSYRMDVFPSHRTANYPKHFLDATTRNATEVKLSANGLAVENIGGGLAFPIPKNGNEIMYDYMARYNGIATMIRITNFYVDANDNLVVGSLSDNMIQWPNGQPGITPEQLKKVGSKFFQVTTIYNGPPRLQGDSNTFNESYEPIANPRTAYAYSASTRRVRLAPDIAYDTPIASTGGIQTYDEAFIFLSKLDRFDFKLIGKKEMYIPYSNYDAMFNVELEKFATPKHINPETMRWELHRVWAVEATLKPGLRHIYSKRVFYFDEDWSGSGVIDEYDQAGKLYKGFFGLSAQLYDEQVPASATAVGYDLSTGNYSVTAWFGGKYGRHLRRDKLWPDNTFTPDGLSSRSRQ